MADPKIFHLLHMSHRAVFRAADRVLTARFGVTAGQHGLLLYLDHHDGASQGAAAQALGLKGASMSGLVDRMEAKGRGERRPSETDKRAYGLHLTAEGAALVAATAPLITETNAQLLAGYSAQDRARIGTFLEDVIRRADAFDADALHDETGEQPANRKRG